MTRPVLEVGLGCEVELVADVRLEGVWLVVGPVGDEVLERWPDMARVRLRGHAATIVVRGGQR